jgi:hypothetical protein
VKATDPTKLDRIGADARRAAAKGEQGYGEQALKIYPCASAIATASRADRLGCGEVAHLGEEHAVQRAGRPYH